MNLIAGANRQDQYEDCRSRVGLSRKSARAAHFGGGTVVSRGHMQISNQEKEKDGTVARTARASVAASTGIRKRTRQSHQWQVVPHYFAQLVARFGGPRSQAGSRTALAAIVDSPSHHPTRARRRGLVVALSILVCWI